MTLVSKITSDTFAWSDKRNRIRHLTLSTSLSLSSKRASLCSDSTEKLLSIAIAEGWYHSRHKYRKSAYSGRFIGEQIDQGQWALGRTPFDFAQGGKEEPNRSHSV